MKVEVLKRGLFLLVFLFLIGVVNAVPATVIISPNSLLETNTSSFSLRITNDAPFGGVGINNITLILDGFVIIDVNNPGGGTYEHVNDSNVIMWYNYSIPSDGSTHSFRSTFEAKRVSLNTTFTWVLKLKDEIGEINSYNLPILVIDDATPPTYNIITPQNNAFTNNASQNFSIDVQDLETGIEGGNLNYALCGSAVYTDQPMTCNQTNCYSNLPITLDSWDDLCYNFTIYNKGGSSVQTDLFLLNIDKSGPDFNLIYLEQLNNTNDEDGIINFNFSLNDEIGVKNCSLFLNDNLSITTFSENITYNVGLSNSSYNFSILCYDELGNSNQTPLYKIYSDATIPTIDSLVCTPDDGDNGNGIVNCNITVTDVTGINNCSLYINDTLDQTLFGSDIKNNFTTSVPASNDPYSRYIICTDNAGNTITTPTETFYYDNIAPQISNNKSTTGSNSATITWNTDEFADSQVIYSTDLTLSLSTAVGPIDLTHTRPINSLAESTTYNYQILSTDKWGNVNDTMPVTNFTTTASGGGDTGGSGGGGGSCTADWTCLQWSNCLDGQQTCTEYKKTCNRDPPVKYQTQNCSMNQPEIKSSETQETRGTQQVTGSSTNVSESSIPPTGSVIGPFATGIGYLIALLFLLAFLILTYFFYQRGKYPRIKPSLIEKDLAPLKSADQPKSIKQFSPKPAVQQNVKIPKPIIPSKQEKIRDVSDFMKNYRSGNFNKKV